MKTTFQDLKTKINLTQTHALIAVSVVAGIAFLVAIVYYRRYQKAIKSEKEADELKARTQKMYEKMIDRTDNLEDMLSNALVLVKKSQELLKTPFEKEGKQNSEKAKTETSAKSTEKVEPEVAVANEVSEAEKEQIRTELSASLRKKPQDKIGDVVSNVIENGQVTDLALAVISKVVETEPEPDGDLE